MAKDIQVISKQLYPLVEKCMTPSTITEFKKMVGVFMDKRSSSLYDTAPCDRIIFTEDDADMLFKTIKIEKSVVTNIMSKLYYWDIASFNPRAAKDEFTVLALCVLRYFYMKKDQKNLELSLIYLSFSGKFYPSVHYMSFPKFQPSEYRHIMDYVINNELSQKYDIKRYGSVIETVKSVGLTWINTYGSRLKDFDDEDIVYLIQQLRDRIKSFIINIAEVYYRVYDNKDVYMTYDSDNLSDEGYRLVDSDSLRIERYVEGAMNDIVSKGVDPKIIKITSNESVRFDELKSILETITNDQMNLPLIKELITILVSQYFLISKDKDISNINFITTSITPKPNTKNKDILRINEILEIWLNENSPSYRKRKSRLATKLGYHKAVLSYFVLVTHNASKRIR